MMIVISLAPYLLPRAVSRRITLSYRGPWGMISKRDGLASAEGLEKSRDAPVIRDAENLQKRSQFSELIYLLSL